MVRTVIRLQLFVCRSRRRCGFLRQLLQERGGLPEFAVGALEFQNAVVDFLQSHGIGVPHGAAAIGRESVAIEVDDVDIDGAQGESFFEDARAFVDQRVDAAIDDFFG